MKREFRNVFEFVRIFEGAKYRRNDRYRVFLGKEGGGGRERCKHERCITHNVWQERGRVVRRGDYALEALLEQSVLCPSVRDDLSQRVATRGVCTRVLTGIYTESGLGEWCVREPGHSPVPRTAGRKSAAKISRGKSIYHRTPRTPLQERVLFFLLSFFLPFFFSFLSFSFFPFFLSPRERAASTHRHHDDDNSASDSLAIQSGESILR